MYTAVIQVHVGANASYDLFSATHRTFTESFPGVQCCKIKQGRSNSSLQCIGSTHGVFHMYAHAIVGRKDITSPLQHLRQLTHLYSAAAVSRPPACLTLPAGFAECRHMAVAGGAPSPAVLPAWGVPSRPTWVSKLFCTPCLLTSAASALAGCPGMTLEPSAPTGLTCICSEASCCWQATEVPAAEKRVRQELICWAMPRWLCSQVRRR